MTPRFVALARVSSREQEREGFSLDVQEAALERHASSQGGEIVRFYRIAETATRREERSAFKELLAYAKEHAAELGGVLFYKVDRAARNLFDYVELERLEETYGVPVVYVTQPTENTPAGRMQRRILANMAAFYTEQQSLDVKEGQARRVQAGLFVGMAPYGYRNVRTDGRSLVEVHPVKGPNVRRIFEMYAYHGHTLDSLKEALLAAGVVFSERQPAFTRSKLHQLLRDRSYIGEVQYRGTWYPGAHPPLVDLETWNRVQALLGSNVYRNHERTYSGGLVKCAHCGRPVTVEVKTKRSKRGEREYVYYRCSRYNAKGHPRVRVREADLDAQALALFDRIRIEDDDLREWFRRALHAYLRETQKGNVERQARVEAELRSLRTQADRLLNLRLLGEIDGETFAPKHKELQERIARTRLQLDVNDREQSEIGEIALKAFELSQALREKWLTADPPAKRRLLEIVCLNLTLDGVTLCPTIRKPFDILAEGLSLKNGRGERI